MLSGKMWPAHPKPLPDELLSSWIVRVAEANAIKLQTLSWMLFGNGVSPWNRDIDRNAPRWLIDVLCEHTGSSYGEVFRMALVTYGGRLYPHRQAVGQLRWILPIRNYGMRHRAFGQQFCPECLAQDSIFYRGGAEQKIRQYLVDNNYVETVISLAPNLFYGTTIAVNILVLAKNKKDTTTQFIDASGLFKKETNNNVLLDAHIEQIMAVFDSKANVDHFAKSAPLEEVVAKEYNLSVSTYVEAKDNREVVDIEKLNDELETTVEKINQLRAKIDGIVARFGEIGRAHV